MELLRILIKESLPDAALIFAACVVAGISEAGLLCLILEAVGTKHHQLSYLIILPCTGLLFVLSFYIYQSRASALAEQAMEKMILTLCDEIRMSELPTIEEIGKSDIYAHLWNARTVTGAALKAIFTIHRCASLCTIWLYILVKTSPAAAMAFTVSALLYALVCELFQNISKPVITEERRITAAMLNAFNHILYGFKEVRLNRRKNDDLFENHITPLISMTETVRIQSSIFLSEFMRFNMLAMIICASLFALTLPFFPENARIIPLLIFYTNEPVMTIALGISDITEGKVAMEELSRLCEHVRHLEHVKSEFGAGPIRDFQTIMLENIEFVYEGERGFALGPLNLNIRAGEILFVTGGNGSGKSTLLKLLCGLYPPSAGQVSADGLSLNMQENRHLFSAIFTDFHLFDALYGIESAEDQSVNDLLEQFDILGKTQFSDGRFSTLNLSAGQRKRLAFIVALLEDRPVYIFDEWAAEQDPEFRKHFYLSLLPSLKARGKTVIAVTHDDHYFYMADRVVKLEYGKIIPLSV